MQSASLLSLATAVPPRTIEQHEAKARAREAFGGKKELFDRLSGVFDNAGIARRHIVAPHDWYLENHGWHDRNEIYLEAAQSLFLEAASSAIEQAGLQPDEIDGVVTVSTTGIATPSLEARVGSKLGLRDDVRRVPLFGLGCAGGVSGLATASRLAVAEPGSKWLMVTIETCSISIRLDSDDPAAVVATAGIGSQAFGGQGYKENGFVSTTGTPLTGYRAWTPGYTWQEKTAQNVNRFIGSSNATWRPFTWNQTRFTLGTDHDVRTFVESGVDNAMQADARSATRVRARVRGMVWR